MPTDRAVQPAVVGTGSGGPPLDHDAVGAAVERFGTPLWLLDGSRLADNLAPWCDATQNGPFDAFYSVKANAAPPVLRAVLDAGLGLDVAGEFDVIAASANGASPDRLTFCSKAPNPEDLRAGLACGTVVAANDRQVEAWRSLGRTSVGLRVNPAVDAGFHSDVRTGPAGRRFGVPIKEIDAVITDARRRGVTIEGFHCHLGSDILDVDRHLAAATVLFDLAARHKAIRWLNLGGGYGVPFPIDDRRYDLDRLFRALRALVDGTTGDLEVRFEPGTAVARDAGWLVTAVTTSIESEQGQQVECDASVNHLPGALLYGTQHPVGIIRRDRRAPSGSCGPTMVSGNLMQPGDVLLRDTPLPRLIPGDLLAFGLAGAYTAVRASTFNGRPLPAEVWLGDGKLELVRRRRTASELYAEMYG